MKVKVIYYYGVEYIETSGIIKNIDDIIDIEIIN